jgi:hypothetical protein
MKQNPSSIERRSFLKWLGSSAGMMALGLRGLDAAEQISSVRFATFRADVTPPIGAPLCGGLVKPVAGITDPLLALGVVILGAGKPIVLCAVDWCEIRAADHVQWRERLAKAAGTTPERVAVQSLHQHNAPLADTVAARMCAEAPSPLQVLDIAWANSAAAGVAQAIADSLKHTQPLTHISHGEAKVTQVASNRRVMGDAGKVAFVRTSATKDARVRDMPEGLIDPMLKTVSFWNDGRKLATLHYYATHPMSFYGDGLVSCDFVGLARERRTRDDGVPHIYFTGCGGNVTAGKYNDGNPANRAVLTGRIHAAMAESEEKMQRVPVGRIEWRVMPVLLAANPEFTEEDLLKLVANEKASSPMRISAAFKLSYMRHVTTRTPIQFTSLHLGDHVRLLHLPGEAFVEYQLFAQQQSPGSFVATASYGDGGPGYIPLEKSFAEGGYEPTQAVAAPVSEKAMKEAIVQLLGGQ